MMRSLRTTEQSHRYNRRYDEKYPGRRAVQVRETYLQRTYSLDSTAIDITIELQRGCAICHARTPGRRRSNWIVDHSHTTKSIRGVICHLCNAALGFAKDDPNLLRAMADYLEREHG
jgi:hypothetical protein